MSVTRRIFSSLALGVPLLGQVQPPEPAEEGELAVIKTFVRFVLAPTTVTDRDGRYVSDIQPHEFRLVDRGKEQKLRVDLAFQPLEIVVCIQANNTVEPVLDKIKQIGPLLENLVLGEKGQAAIIAFDHRIRTMQEFTNDGALFKKALAKINAGSTTSAMNDAVIAAARMLKNRPNDHRKVILLISETRDKGSEAKTRQALLDLQFGNIVVYSVNINRLVTSLLTKAQPPRPDPLPPGARHMPAGSLVTPETISQQTGIYNGNVVPLAVEVLRQVKGIFVDNQLEVFTKFTGGSERSFLTYKDLERVIADIGEELHSQYMISYSPNNTEEGGFHPITVEVARTGLTVRTRPGYWMAAIPQ